MRLKTKRVLAMIMAASLVVVMIPQGGEGYASAAQPLETEKNTIAAMQQNEVQSSLRGASQEDEGVVFSKESGTYSESFDLQLSCADPNATIYFTTDGSDPSDVSNEMRQVCTGGSVYIDDRADDPNVLAAIDPILYDAVNVKASSDGKSFESTVEKPSDEDVDKCTVIKAAAQYADGTCSEVTTNTYFIGEMADHIEGIRESCEAAGMDLAVMSISMDADDLFDSTKGIYVKGDIFDQALADYLEEEGEIWDAVNTSRDLDANYKQKGRDWERETHIDYFESDGTETTCELQQDCGIRIQGNYSRSDYQKGFRLFAREDYGNKNFKYGFWDSAVDDDGNVIEKYKKIVLRNGGNCAFTTKFSDAYWQSLMEGLDCDKQSARPCVVYLNGEYWGVYILQDDFCGAYMENKHGVEKDDVVIYKGDAEANQELGYKLDEGDLPSGVTNEDYYFQDLEDFMSNHDDLSDTADYEAFCELVDKDSALDYFATEVWINNKWDWPGKNWSMWKTTTIDPNNPYADGKWRFLIYDVEFGGISGASDATANTVKESKLLSTGTAEYGDTNWDKPNVRCFALLMTNSEFREEFKARLESFSETIFEREHALEVAEQFKDVYQPILDQFFKRFPTLWDGEQKTADMVINGNGWDTYGTWANIVAFVEERADYINTITAWIDKQYSSSTPLTPSATPGNTAVPPSTQNAVKPTAAPTQSPTANNSSKQVKVKLCDGAVKLVQVDKYGNVVSTKYRVGGITYTLKSDHTLTYSAENNQKLKKKKSVVIPDVVVAGGNQYKVTEIQKGALKGLKQLKKVTIGENIKKIGANSFKGCKKLKEIRIIGKKLKKIGNNAFKGIAKKAKLTCPKAKKKTYQKLMKKSGVKIKQTKLKIVKLKQSSNMGTAKSSGTAQNNDSNGIETMGLPVAGGNSRKGASDETTITMSSLVKEDGSFQAASANAVVTIESAEELKLLSEYTNANKKTSGVTFRQIADIDGTGVVMNPIGMYNCIQEYEDDDYGIAYEGYPFYGTYDGNGYQIQNLTISIQKSPIGEYYLGMFATVQEAILQNIDLRSIDFVNEETLEPFVTTDAAYIYMAGIVAYAQYNSQIEGCSNYADLTAAGEYAKVAGIVGESDEVIVRDCHNYGTITMTGEAGLASGIISSVDNGISDCSNEGTVTGNVCAAGIVCRIFSGDAQNCENTGNITGGTMAAGIVAYGYADGNVITSCKNAGTIQAELAGGIVTYLSDCAVVSSENTGTIQGTDCAGGIAGEVEYDSEVSVVKNQGKITAVNMAGGIVGCIDSANVANAQNFGSVTAEKIAGGMIGFSIHSKLLNLWNHGNVSGDESSGGIVGSSDLALYEDYDELDIATAVSDYANIYGNCIQLGTLAGAGNMGAVVGYSKLQDQISYCYYLEGTAVLTNGCDEAITAQTVTSEVWSQQSFLDELNQNIVTMNEMSALPMSYDAQNELQWEPQIIINIQVSSVTPDKDALNRLNLKFEAEDQTTGELISFEGADSSYRFSPTSGTDYTVYRIMPDGTKNLIGEVCLQEGESIYTFKLIFGTVEFYTDVSWSLDEDGYQYYDADPYTTLYYEYYEELEMPADPTKEGYIFAGWYSSADVTSDEVYAEHREQLMQEFESEKEWLQSWWSEESDYLSETFDSEEEFVQYYLEMFYGYSDVTTFTENYDQYFEDRYRVTELYTVGYDEDEDEEYSFLNSSKLYAKWVKKTEQTLTPPAKSPNNTDSASTNISAQNVTKIDPSKYQDKVGNYVQKKGLIYKVNRKKKTATVVGVTSKDLKTATIVKKVTTGGKNYKVTGIKKNAFKGCRQLKKIKAKGKSLKKVRKKALKLLQKK